MSPWKIETIGRSGREERERQRGKEKEIFLFENYKVKRLDRERKKETSREGKRSDFFTNQNVEGRLGR